MPRLGGRARDGRRGMLASMYARDITDGSAQYEVGICFAWVRTSIMSREQAV